MAAHSPRPESSPDDIAWEGAPRLWRSLEECAEAPDVRGRFAAEFPEAVQGWTIDRRNCLRLMAASLALAGVGCDRNRGGVGAPLFSQPRGTPGHTPGMPLFFATSLELDGYGRGVLVKTQDGRPIKIEGNPLHPASLGATDPFLQAEVLSLYDPSRSPGPTEGGEARDWNTVGPFLWALRDDFVASEGRGLAVLMQPVASPTRDRLTTALRAMLPEARWHSFAPITDHNRRAGAELAFGRAVEPIYDLTSADVILTLGGDLFASEPGHLRYAADYQARRRAAPRPLPRLIAVESTPSLVGSRADERIALRPRDMEWFARGLAAAFGVSVAAPGETHSAVPRLAAQLRRAGSRGIVSAGREQPAAVHALAYAINDRIGAAGSTVRLIEPLRPGGDELASMRALSEVIARGEVFRLLILGGNPAYDAPADLDFAELIRRVPLSVHLGYGRNETAAACRWHIPQCHALEAFGDLRAFDGTVGLCQPATARLAPSLSIDELLGALVAEGTDGRALLAKAWRGAWGDHDFEGRFMRAVEEGVVSDTASPSVDVSVRTDWDQGPRPRDGKGSIDIVFAPDASMWDGRYASNGWLQELPKPLTKQVWGNAALISPDTAERQKLRTGDVIEIAADGRTIAAPVWVLPGQAPDTLTLPLGYGRSMAGALGSGIGFDGYRLRGSREPWMTAGEIRSIGRREALVTTQQHHSMHGRAIVRTVPAESQSLPAPPPQPSLYPEWPYEGHAWGMAIDLDACIGCNACVIACQAENNVAVVGPEQVARGREMHWLRVDRYYAARPEDPRTYFQPVPCMHCENAPCEVVCPVNATVHSSEGLNDMVYNRCIGTRTCSNNCPYKVRRFNFLDYQSAAYAASDEVMNPQVTVRDRGVMEKCTYCVQRIAAARIEAGIENRRVKDGEIVTACQQACPTQAIVFGDVNDPASRVRELKRSARNYALLGELNTRPRTSYLARIEAPPEEGRG
jgi:MoCo/4Fe-4S cofactor protein with predicted Tat translocation signal